MKNYTIRYSKSGVYQYASFREDDDGIIVYKSFHPTWVNINEVPSLEKVNTIEEILQVIKDFSYSNCAEIYLIDGMIPEYYNNTQIQIDTKNHISTIEKVINAECYKFFQTHVIPILIKNNWFISTSHIGIPIIIYKNEESEWDNIKHDNDDDELLVEFMCYELINGLGLYTKEVNFKSEHNKPILHGFSHLIRQLTYEQVKSTNLFIEL